MVEAHLAEGEGARVVADDLLAEAEAPGGGEGLVRGGGDGTATG